eukprot:3233068-Karenia_brevis.AAC.1
MGHLGIMWGSTCDHVGVILGSSGVVFFERQQCWACTACGHWARTKVQGLGEPCARVKNNYGASSLRALAKGEVPYERYASHAAPCYRGHTSDTEGWVGLLRSRPRHRSCAAEVRTEGLVESTLRQMRGSSL